MTSPAFSSQPHPEAKRAAAIAAGYALVPVHPVLAARESVNSQRGERAREAGAR